MSRVFTRAREINVRTFGCHEMNFSWDIFTVVFRRLRNENLLLRSQKNHKFIHANYYYYFFFYSDNDT